MADYKTMSSKNIAKELATEDAYYNKELKSIHEGGDTIYIRTNIPRINKRSALAKEYTKRRNNNPHSDQIRNTYYKERNKIRKDNGLKPLSFKASGGMIKKYSYGGRVANSSAEKS